MLVLSGYLTEFEEELAFELYENLAADGNFSSSKGYDEGKGEGTGELPSQVTNETAQLKMEYEGKRSWSAPEVSIESEMSLV